MRWQAPCSDRFYGGAITLLQPRAAAVHSSAFNRASGRKQTLNCLPTSERACAKGCLQSDRRSWSRRQVICAWRRRVGRLQAAGARTQLGHRSAQGVQKWIWPYFPLTFRQSRSEIVTILGHLEANTREVYTGHIRRCDPARYVRERINRNPSMVLPQDTFTAKYKDKNKKTCRSRFSLVRSRRLELPRVAPQRPQRCASTNSATTASW